MTDHYQSRLLTAAQAAAYLGVGERTLWALGASGQIPRVTFGGGKRQSVRYDRFDLDAWVTAQKQGR